MKQFGSIFRALRLSAGLSQSEVASYISEDCKPITNKIVSYWERDMYTPNMHQFLCLCRLYGVTDACDVFMNESNMMNTALNTEGWEKVREYIELLSQDKRYTEKRQFRVVRSLPRYFIPASAGTGQFLDSGDYEMVEVGEDVPMSANFGIQVAGNSMEPRYSNGDVVWVQQQQTLEDGEIGIFMYNGDAYIKQLAKENGEVALVSLNEEYPPIYPEEGLELRVFGKVVT